MILIYAFAAIGAFVVLVIGASLSREVIRSIRQGMRVAAIASRLYNRRPASWRECYFAIGREFFRSYSSLIIGFVEIPHDPSKPIRARLPR